MAEKSEELVTIEEKLTQAKELFVRGSRNFLVRAYNDAADDLSQVCNTYEEIHGQLSDELGVPYLLYAKTLIALAEDENKVLSVPEEQNDDDEDDEDDEGEGEGDDENESKKDDEGKVDDEKKADETKPDEKSNETEDSSKSEQNVSEAVDSKTSPAKSSEKGDGVNGKEKGDETVKESKEMKSTDAKDAAEPGTSNGPAAENNEENDEDDDAANLQVAWEILELAVKIFERQGEPARNKLAEAYSELASISFENSHFDAAIADYKKSLDIHMKLPDDNRRIVAEIHYKIGLAHLMQNAFDTCVAELKRASELIEEEIDEKKLKEDQTDKEKDLIKDLEETKQDILAKITEVEETKTQSIEDVRKELSKLIHTEPDNTDGAGPSTSSNDDAAEVVSSTTSEQPKPTDISHLIKRKKPDTGASNEAESSPAKRPAV